MNSAGKHAADLHMREAEDGDYPRCAEIYNDGWNFALPEQPRRIGLAEFLGETSGEKIVVALNQRTIVGYVSVWRPECFIHHLYVDPVEHGKGVGRLLLKRVFDFTSSGCVSLKCQKANQRALGFYGKCGFQATGHGGADAFGEWLELARAADTGRGACV